MRTRTIDDILAAVDHLNPADMIRLRRKLDSLEKKIWQKELARTTAELKKARLTDAKIDRFVLRRRRESRR